MQIDCPSCARTYLVSRDALGEAGRHLVCQFCATRWLAKPTEESFPDEPFDLHAVVPDEFAVHAGSVTAADGETGCGRHEDGTAGEELADLDAWDAPPAPAPWAADILNGAGVSGPAFADDTFAAPEENASWPGGNDDLTGGIFAIREARLAAPRQNTQRPRRRPGALRPAAALAACLLLGMGLIGKREAVARVLPGTRALYAAMGLPVHPRPLEFGNVTTARLDDGTSIAVSGTIHNAARRRVDVPRLSFEIRDAGGLVVASWSENPPKRSLGAEETLAFSSTTTAPGGSKDVAVHFTTEAPVKSLRAMVGRAPVE